MSLTSIVPPTLEGFVDGRIDHLLSTGADALFDMYESVLLGARPNFFQMQVRDMANDFIDDALGFYRCPANDEVEDEMFIDSRDLLLLPAEAELAGGKGGARHGNVVLFGRRQWAACDQRHAHWITSQISVRNGRGVQAQWNVGGVQQ